MRLFTKAGEELTLDQLTERLAILRKTSSGVTVTPETALKSPTVFAIVNRLAAMFAQLPFSVVRDESTATRQQHNALPDHRVTQLLNRKPNKFQTAFTFRAQMLTQLLLRGRYLAEIARSRDEIRLLTPIADPPQAEVDRRHRVTFRFSTRDGEERTLRMEDALYVCSPVTLDGVNGISPIEACAEAVALEIASEKFGGSLFGSSAVPSLILMRQGKFQDDEAAQRFKTGWLNLFRGKRSTAVLEGDEWKVEQIQMTNEDSQFLETRKLQRSILAGMFNVPPHMVGDLERATFSNISSQALEVLMYTLSPWLENIEAAISRSLLSDDEVEAGLFCRFDTKRLLRGDLKSTADFIGRMRQWGILSANDGRAMLDMNAREDEAGDDYLTPLNMVDQDTDVSDGGTDAADDADDEGDVGTENGRLRSVP